MEKKMRCRDIQKLIPLFLDSQLSPRESSVVGEHLSGCVLCQKELNVYQRSWDMLKEWQDMQPAAGYAARFWTQVTSPPQPWYTKILSGLKEASSRRQISPALVTVCLVFILTSILAKTYFQAEQTDRYLTRLNSEEIELLEDMELAQHFDVIKNIEILEDFDILKNLDSLKS